MGRSHKDKESIKNGILNSEYFKNEEWRKKDWFTINSDPERLKKQKETWIKKLYERGWGNLKKTGKKSIVLYEQKYACLNCQHDSWMGESLVLELDHIDGNKKNESRENLRCLCPNCHSLTPTWRRKKK